MNVCRNCHELTTSDLGFCCEECYDEYHDVTDERCQQCGVVCCDGDCDGDYEYDMDDVEADADTLANAGWGTDEDYGYYGDDEYPW